MRKGTKGYKKNQDIIWIYNDRGVKKHSSDLGISTGIDKNYVKVIKLCNLFGSMASNVKKINMNNGRSVGKWNLPPYVTLPDARVVEKVLAGETELFEILLRRHNQLLFRTIRSYMDRPSDIDDVMQDTYIKAFQKLFQYKNEALFSTWLIRIGINEVLQRKRRSKRYLAVDFDDEAEVVQIADTSIMNPERKTMYSESVHIVEMAIDQLPEKYKVIYMLKEVEDLGITEISASLGLSVSNVKVRLHRARNMMKDAIFKISNTKDVFEFGNSKCDRLVLEVMLKIHNLK